MSILIFCEWSTMFDIKSWYEYGKRVTTTFIFVWVLWHWHPFVSGVHWHHFVPMPLLLRVVGLISFCGLWRLYHKSVAPRVSAHHHRGLCDFWSNVAQYRYHSLLYIYLVWNWTRYKTHWWLSFPSGTLNWVIFLIFHWIYRHCDLQCLN